MGLSAKPESVGSDPFGNDPILGWQSFLRIDILRGDIDHSRPFEDQKSIEWGHDQLGFNNRGNQETKRSSIRKGRGSKSNWGSFSESLGLPSTFVSRRFKSSLPPLCV